MTAIQMGNPNTYFLGSSNNRWMAWIAVSLFLHLLIFALAYFESRRVDHPDQLYQKAIMVKPVRWAPKERPKNFLPVKDVEPVVEAPKPEAIKVAPNDAIKENKKIEKVKEKKPEKTAEQKRKERQLRMQRALKSIKKENQRLDGSPDGVRGAHSAEAIRILGSAYAGQLIGLFNSNFTVPEVIPEEEYSKLQCKILVKIDRTGRIIHHHLQQGSGNSQFDSSALKAVKLTEKVPLPDELLQNMVFNEGILINFRWKK